MKNIEGTEWFFVIFMTIMAVVLIVVAIAMYQEVQSRIKWRESASLEIIEAVNEYIQKQADYETTYE